MRGKATKHLGQQGNGKRTSSVKLALLRLSQPREAISFMSKNGLQAIPDETLEISGEIWREPCRQEVQQEPVMYLLLAGPLGRKCKVPDLPYPHSCPNQRNGWTHAARMFPRPYHPIKRIRNLAEKCVDCSGSAARKRSLENPQGSGAYGFFFCGTPPACP